MPGPDDTPAAWQRSSPEWGVLAARLAEVGDPSSSVPVPLGAPSDSVHLVDCGWDGQQKSRYSHGREHAALSPLSHYTATYRPHSYASRMGP